ncbi:MAG: hypothetical protein DRH26_00680 [Deltaproteobacteria bacterium]|nr:MAG: hypothetical protein DRH26_00680 [Deltaproteobacteria bacterium]
MKNKDIAIALNISDALVSRLLSGERKVSWPLAERLSKMFPGRSISEWKRVNPEEIKRVFEHLEIGETV